MKKSGGAPINFVYHATQLGAEGYAISAVGNDVFGTEIIQELDKNGIDSNYISTVEYPTGSVMVELKNGIPSYTIIEGVAWDHIPFTQASIDLMKRADAVCFGTLAQRAAESRETLRTLLSYMPSHALRFFDINIRQHFACNFGHAGFGITVSSRGVAVHGTKVALAVNQRITQAEILCQTHHRVIHTGVAVGVVSTQHSTNRIRRLAVRVAGVVAALVHRVQDAAVYGLQAIAHIRQGTGYDNGHGIIQKCRFDLLLDIAHNDLRARTGHHDNIFFHSTHLSDCFKALLQKLHRKSSLYHQNIKNKIHQRLAAAEISTVIRGGNRLPTRSGRTMCAPTGAAIRPAP